MIKPKFIKVPQGVSTQMALLHLRWQQIRLELLQATLTPPTHQDAEIKKTLQAS